MERKLEPWEGAYPYEEALHDLLAVREAWGKHGPLPVFHKLSRRESERDEDIRLALATQALGSTWYQLLPQGFFRAAPKGGAVTVYIPEEKYRIRIAEIGEAIRILRIGYRERRDFDHAIDLLEIELQQMMRYVARDRNTKVRSAKSYRFWTSMFRERQVPLALGLVAVVLVVIRLIVAVARATGG